ncbi:MAG: polar localization protein TipN, partial [Phenylobacterium sp.]
MSKRVRPADFGASPDQRPAEPPIAREAEPAFDAFEDYAEPTLEAPTAPAGRGEVAAVAGRAPVPRKLDQPDYEAVAEDALKPPPGWPIYLVALAVAVLWALAPIAFAVGYRGGVEPLRQDAFALAVFALLAIGPAFFVFGAAYMLRQGQKLAAEARRARAMAEDMLTPAMTAAGRAGQVV